MLSWLTSNLWLAVFLMLPVQWAVNVYQFTRWPEPAASRGYRVTVVAQIVVVVLFVLLLCLALRAGPPQILGHPLTDGHPGGIEEMRRLALPKLG